MLGTEALSGEDHPMMEDSDAPTPEEAAAPGSLDRALRIVFAIADGNAPDVGVSELSRSLGMPKAAVHRILKTFTAHGFLSFDERSRRYQFGPGALAVGLAAVRNLDVPVVARPYLERMVASSGETATLSVLQGSERIYVDQVLSPQEVRLSAVLGRPYPLYAGAASKVLLAANGQAFGSISICGPADRFPPERVRRWGGLVTRTAAELSTAIGHRHAQ